MAEKKSADKTPATETATTDDAAKDPVIETETGDSQTDAAAGTKVIPAGENVDIPKSNDGPPDGPPPDDVADAAGDPPEKVKSKPVIEGKASTGTDKKAADKVKREAAIKEHQEAIAKAPVNEELKKADEIKDDIRERMDEIVAEVAEHDQAINVLRDESAELLLELYPQQGESDKHSVAVRGYLNASARDREHRKLSPVRLKALLQKAGLAPIDAAFSRARGRGMARPVRKALTQGAPAGADQAKGAIPDKTAKKAE